MLLSGHVPVARNEELFIIMFTTKTRLQLQKKHILYGFSLLPPLQVKNKNLLVHPRHETDALEQRMLDCYHSI